MRREDDIALGLECALPALRPAPRRRSRAALPLAAALVCALCAAALLLA
ncbi:MAG: hypothetical protein N2653_09875 [Burkholderiales bacterium]|nr:hypothetical protein [Burkholderiales bacterium]